ncbi:MAG: TetR/AcrR family transcriptional regulator [Bacillota bacterium]|nr:TetR/AcrR family transcriptional regulator [Bacillota bacterium]
MGITERRQSEIENLKKKIIDAASEILSKDGFEKLSIRKIADKIEYSPGIIYHYFKDKNELLYCVVEENYDALIKALSKIPVDNEHPEKTIINGMKTYIEFMLKNPESFKAIMMNNIESIESKVNMLEKNISKKRTSMKNLTELIEIGIKKGFFKTDDAELTAQIIWTSTYGLLSRLILEKNVTKEQKEKLINHNFEVLINGILTRK